MQIQLTPELLLNAYANGYFPMAESGEDETLYWFSPEQRGILPLETFHIPRSLKRFLTNCTYHIHTDTAFKQVITGCAEAPRPKAEGTWINQKIITLFCELHDMGYAHSVECWEDEKLIGGLYGLSLGGAFFGESMFSVKTNASKVALIALVYILRTAGYTLLDTQYTNTHLKQFGNIAIPKEDYLMALQNALNASPSPSSRFVTVAGTIDKASSLPINKTLAASST